MLIRALPAPKSAGFTLAEMLIAITVFGILVSLGMPSFFKMLRNAELRAAAESIASGMQRARAEAVSRNTAVHFALVPYTTSWTVDLVAGAAATPIDARESSNDGSAHTKIRSYPVAGGIDATKVTFNPLGQIVANAAGAGNQRLERVEVEVTGSDQRLHVLIGAGGAARVCDPAYVAPHIRAC